MIGVPACEHFVYTSAERGRTAGYQVTAQSSGIDDAALSLVDGYIYPANINPTDFEESRSLLVAKDKIAYSMVKNIGVGYDGRDGTLYNHTLIMRIEDFSRLGYDTRVLEQYFINDYSIQGDLEPIDVQEQTMKPDFRYMQSLDPGLLEIALHGIVRNARLAIGAPDQKLIPGALSVVPRSARLRSFSTCVVQPVRQPKYRIIQMPRLEASKIPPQYARVDDHPTPSALRAARQNDGVRDIMRVIRHGTEAELAGLLDRMEVALAAPRPKMHANSGSESSVQKFRSFDVLKDVLDVHAYMNDLVGFATGQGAGRARGAGRWPRDKQAVLERILRVHKNVGNALRSDDPAIKKPDKKLLKKALQVINDSLSRADMYAKRAPGIAGGPFSVSPHDINRLSPDECARFFADLLYCDARRLEVPIDKIRFTDKTMRDGGIDVSVGRAATPGHVLHGNHFYQIKAGEDFSPWQKKKMSKELLIDGSALKPEIRRCFEEDGTYVLVCVQKQMTSQQIHKSTQCIRDVAKSCGIKDPKVKVWGQDHIMQATTLFPSVLLRFRDYGNVRTHSRWSDGLGLIHDKTQNERIEEIRTGIRNGSRHIDVCGDVGTGKTKIVFEATRSRDLSSLVAYCPSPDDLPGVLESHIVNGDLACILVVDDCDQEGKLAVAGRMRSAASVQLITISSECGATEKDVLQVSAPALDAKTLEKIIEGYGADLATARRLSYWCQGIPMMAHVFGWALASGLDTLHGPQAKYKVFDKYIDRGSQDPAHLKQRRRILFTMSLFEKFDNGPDFKESDFVCGIARRIDHNITEGIFHEHVSEMRDLGILQGAETVRLRLRPLHVWLWTQWWKHYTSTWDAEMLADMPQSMQDGFIGMFRYAGSSKDAARALGGLFGGPLSKPLHMTTYPGSALFILLAETEPKAALLHLEHVLQSGEALREATYYQRFDPEGPGWGQTRAYRSVESIVRALKAIACRKDLFARAAKMLMRLSEADESQSAPADALASLFTPGIGYISETEAPPKTRLPALKEMLRSEKQVFRNIGFRACAAALSAPDYVFVSQRNDFVPDEPGWVPETRGDLEDAYRNVVDAMLESIDGFSDKDRKECASVMAQRIVDITGRVPRLAGYMADALSGIKDIVGKEEAVKIATSAVGICGKLMSAEDRGKFEQLLEDLAGTSYSDRVERFACMDIIWGYADDPEKERMRELEKLADESDARKLEPELPRLVSKRAKCGGMFGAALAERDAGFALLPGILEAQRAAGPDGAALFLSGYLSVMREKDRGAWRKTMNRISDDEQIVRFMAELYWRSGLDDSGGRHLLDLTRSGKISSDGLGLFVLGSRSKNLSDQTVLQWIEYMSISGEPDAVAGALRLFHSRFVESSSKLPHPEIAVNLLTHDALLHVKHAGRDPILGTCWAETAINLKDHAEHSIVFASAILDKMDAWMDKYHKYVVSALDGMGSARPDDLWDVVVKNAASPPDDKTRAFYAWMRMSNSRTDFLDSVDFAKIRKWIDRNPEERAPLVAGWVRPSIVRTGAARKILARYGSDQRVRDALSGSFLTGAYSGLESRR